MADNPNAGYYRSSQGSLTGFDSANIPAGNPNLATTGWSIEQLRAFLLNQSALNFPSNEWIQNVEQQIRDHESDFNNPHHTTLDQIVGDFVRQVLGNITPGTIPDTSPFYCFDASLGLPFGTIFPATYSTNNLYRQTAGGWFVDTASEDQVIGSDYVSGIPGVPLFSDLTNIIPEDWVSEAGFAINTTTTELDDDSISYPFTFHEIFEAPTIGQFGINLVMTQDLKVSYTTCFFVRSEVTGSSLRVYQPSDPSAYFEVSLDDGGITVFSDVLEATSVKYVDGTIRVSVNFISLSPVADNKLKIIHLNHGQTGDGTRQGTLGRSIFAIGRPQTTKGTLNQPVIMNLANSAETSTFVPDLTRVSAPASLDRVTITIGLSIFPSIPYAEVLDGTIMTFGALSITRNQSQIRVSVSGTLVVSSDILEGLNVFTLSYSPTTLIFKDLANDRTTVSGTYPALTTAGLTFGPCGGYLHTLAMYAQEDTNQLVEFLTNG